MEELIEALIDWKVLVDWEEVLQLPSSTRNILYINHTAWDEGLSAKNQVWRTQKLFGSYLTPIEPFCLNK